LAELAALVDPPFRAELPAKLGSIDPAAMLKVLAPLPEQRRAMESLAALYRKEHNAKAPDSWAWHRARVLSTFKRFEKVLAGFYATYEGGAPGSPVNVDLFPVLRLTRELRESLDAGGLDPWRKPRKSGPITVYVTNDGLTQEQAVRNSLKARYGMGRTQQNWWLRAVGANGVETG
jgi:hypothetical protein